MNHRQARTVLLAAAAVIIAGGFSQTQAHAQAHWPDYRGPSVDGHIESANLPTTWSETENVVWQTEIPYSGLSSPIVYGDQAWLTTATDDGHELYAICVDVDTGEVIHNVRVFEEDNPQRINPFNTHASPSAVIEQGRVYVHFGSYGTAALDTDTAEVIWERRDLNLDHEEGAGSSPILYGDLLIFHCDGYDVQYVVALDKATGETVWKQDRSVDFGGLANSRRKSYATPVVYEIDGRPQLVSQGAEALYGYDPYTGEELWRLEYSGYSNVPRPVFGHGRFFISTGYNSASLVAVPLEGLEGVLSDAHFEWEMSRQAPLKPSFVLVDDLIYIVSDGGIAQAIDVETGQSVWQERFGGQFSASPIYDGRHIYFFGHEGHTVVFEPGREFNEVARNELGEGVLASPAVVDDALIIRTANHLYRIEE